MKIKIQTIVFIILISLVGLLGFIYGQTELALRNQWWSCSQSSSGEPYFCDDIYYGEKPQVRIWNSNEERTDGVYVKIF